MKKIARKIIHYVGVAIKMPCLALFTLSYIATYLLQLVSAAVRVAFDEPNVKEPFIDLRNLMRDLTDILEEVINTTRS